MITLDQEQTRMLLQFTASAKRFLQTVETADVFVAVVRDGLIDDAAAWHRIILEQLAGRSPVEASAEASNGKPG